MQFFEKIKIFEIFEKSRKSLGGGIGREASLIRRRGVWTFLVSVSHISLSISVAAAQRSVSVCGEAREAVGEGGGTRPGGGPVGGPGGGLELGARKCNFQF